MWYINIIYSYNIFIILTLHIFHCIAPLKDRSIACSASVEASGMQREAIGDATSIPEARIPRVLWNLIRCRTNVEYPRFRIREFIYLYIYISVDLLLVALII